MKLHFYLLALIFSLALTSCGKDDDMMEEVTETSPFFKADFNWDASFLTEAGIAVAADSVPLSMDIMWENPVTIDFDSDRPEVNVAAIGKEDSDDDFYILYSSYAQGGDTTSLIFELYGDIAAKSYTFAAGDILDFIFSGEGEIPPGTIIPYLISEKSEAAITPALITIFGAVDFSGSSFEITEYDETTKEVSGEFNINFVIPAYDDQPETAIMKMENGSFNKVSIVE